MMVRTYAAAPRGVWHQHAIAPGERKISRQGRAFAAAFFLDHLDQQNLAALDDFLDLVPPRTGSARWRGINIVAAYRLCRSRFVFTISAVFVLGAFAIFLPSTRFFGRVVARVRGRFVLGRVVCGAVGFSIIVVAAARALVLLVALVRLRSVLGPGQGFFFRPAARRLFRRLLTQQGGAVFDRDLIIIGMDIAKRQKAVTIPAKVHECRLQRGFNPHDLGQVDVTFELFSGGGFNVERIQMRSVNNDHPGFFGVGGIDKQPLYHRKLSP